MIEIVFDYVILKYNIWKQQFYFTVEKQNIQDIISTAVLVPITFLSYAKQLPENAHKPKRD